MSRLYPDMSITEVRLTINIARRRAEYLKIKDIDNPMNEKDYKLLKDITNMIEQLDSSRWTKEFY